MAYCGPRGIPRSTFLSWPDDDQEWALEWMRNERARCPGCGHHADDVFDPDAEGQWDAQLLRCHACAARDAAVEANREINRDGLYVIPRHRHL